MAMKPLRPCRHPGCSALTREGYCQKHKPARAPRRTSAEYHSWYSLSVWTEELLAADMGAAQLDRDTVGRYLVAQHQFTAACRMVQDALDQEDPDLVNKWTRAQKSYFEQARACANDLGLTITSRCRLVVPEARKPEKNPFLQLMEARRRA